MIDPDNMTPDEMRTLARTLTAVANQIDARARKAELKDGLLFAHCHRCDTLFTEVYGHTLTHMCEASRGAQVPLTTMFAKTVRKA